MVQLWRSFGSLLPLVALGGLLVLVAAGAVSWARKAYERSWPAMGHAALDGLLAVWALALAVITLTPGTTPEPRNLAVQLAPFRDLRLLTISPVSWQVPLVQIGGTILLFASGGVLLGLRFGLGWGRSALLFLAIGMGIEVGQLVVAGHVAVIDDVLLAVMGGAVGAWVGRGARGWAIRPTRAPRASSAA